MIYNIVILPKFLSQIKLEMMRRKTTIYLILQDYNLFNFAKIRNMPCKIKQIVVFLRTISNIVIILNSVGSEKFCC